MNSNRSFLIFNGGTYREFVFIIVFENYDHLKTLLNMDIDYRFSARFNIAMNGKDLINIMPSCIPSDSLGRKIIESMNTVMPWPDYIPAISSKESLALLISGKSLKDIIEGDKFERNMVKFVS